MAIACGLPAPAAAAEQADRAVALVRKLVGEGKIRRDAVLRVAFKQGNINALLGADLELQREWERLTGTVVSARVVPQQPAIDILRAHADVDLTVARNNEYADLMQQGLAVDLAPLLAEFGFSLAGDPPQGYIRPLLQSRLGTQVVAIPADGDVSVMYLRKDLLDDPQERAAFRRAAGRDLAAPRTWADYRELVRFFDRPERGLHGTVEQREPATAWMFWLPRFLSRRAPQQHLFDAAMRPLIATPAGIAATEDYVATVRHSPPGITDEGRDYSINIPLFIAGKAFATIGSISFAKLFNAPNSAVRGRFAAVPMPGQQVGKDFVRHNVLIYGNNLVVHRHSPQPALAFLFAMWLTDPDISTRTVGVAGGFTDPYRWHHLGDARIRSLYTPEALAVSIGEWSVATAPGTGLPGDAEYLDALNQQLWRAAKAEVSASEAMRTTAAAWDAITRRYGRERQIAAWQALRNGAAAPEAMLVTP